jgi:hypothetical protein
LSSEDNFVILQSSKRKSRERERKGRGREKERKIGLAKLNILYVHMSLKEDDTKLIKRHRGRCDGGLYTLCDEFVHGV